MSYASDSPDPQTNPDARFIALHYDGLGRLNNISDHTERQVGFAYHSSSGNLITVTDVLGQAWTYEYQTPAYPHHLTEVKNPLGDILEKTEYDSLGRAVRQFNGLDLIHPILELAYLPGGTTTISQTVDGKTSLLLHSYDYRRALAGVQYGAENPSSRVYDTNFRPIGLADPLGRTTFLTWSANGFNLGEIVDALGITTTLDYDSLNNLTSLKDGRGFTTTYVYSGTLLLSSTDGDAVTLYTYTTATDFPQPPGLLKTVEDPNHHLTSYTYDQYGQRIAMQDALGRVTSYGYDSLGRQIKVTLPGSRSDWTCYDAAGRVVRTVANASGNGGSPVNDPCDAVNYVPSSDPLFDRINTFTYDPAGQLIASTDPNGLVTRNYYDAAGRLVRVVSNLSGWDIYNPSPPPPSLFTATQNLTSETVYDLAGNLLASIEWLVEGSQVTSRVTRTYYDSSGRPEYIVQNLYDWPVENNTPPPEYLRTAERNVTTRAYYDAAGNAIASQDPLGRITRTYYDALDRPYLVMQNWSGADIYSTTPPSCNRYEGADSNICSESYYDANGNLTASVDPKGVITRSYYDRSNHPILVVVNSTRSLSDPTLPPTSEFRNDYDVGSETIYDLAGNAIAQVAYLWQNGQVLSTITRTYYDALNRPSLVVRNLDPAHGIQTQTPPACNRDASGLVEPYNLCLETKYDSQTGEAIASFDPLERITRTYYDLLGRPTRVVRNLDPAWGYANPTPPGLSQMTDVQNVSTQTVFDASGNAIASLAWRLEGSQVITLTARSYFDVLGRTTSLVQGFVGELSSITPPDYDPAFPDRNVRRDSVYASDGRMLAEIVWLEDGEGQVVSLITRHYYDELGRMKVVVENLDPAWGIDNPNPPPCNRDATGLGSLYNRCQESFFDAAGQTTSTRDALGKTTNYVYDGLGRLASVSDPLGRVTNYAYDAAGNRTQTTAANQVITRFEYDALGRLAGVWENYRAGYNPDHETNVHTQYDYDALGNRLTISDGLGHLTAFTYDLLGRLESETDPLLHTWQHGFDVSGNRVWMTDANGATTHFVYDALDRLTGIDYPAPDSDASFSYNALGWRKAMSDGLGLTAWEYDDLGRPLAITQPISGTVGYRYDALGSRTRLVYPDGKQAQYGYDLLGRLREVQDWDSRVVTYTYTIAGQPLETHLPNGVLSQRSYDEAGQLLSLSHTRQGVTLSSFTYAHDLIGNRTVVSETLFTPAAAYLPLVVNSPGEGEGMSAPEGESLSYPGPEYPPPGALQSPFWQGLVEFFTRILTGLTPSAAAHAAQTGVYTPLPELRDAPHAAPLLSALSGMGVTVITYTYDPLSRLTAADYSDGTYFHYSYDAVGNRLSETSLAGTTIYAYDLANRLSSVNGVAYTWDNNGNLLQDGANTYTYDHANRLVGFNGPSISATYAYNGIGDRLQESVNGQSTSFSMDLNAGLPRAMSDGTHSYLYGAQRIFQQDGSGEEYFLGDALGSVRQLVDESGMVTLTKGYEPYGEGLGGAGWGSSSYGFTGEWMNNDTSLLYLRARYLALGVGRFISRDTWQGHYEMPLSFNRWDYVMGNPVNHADPSGHLSAAFYVSLAEWVYSKEGLFHCSRIPDNGQAANDRTSDLWFDFLCERGPEHRHFNAWDYLTKELAWSEKIHRERFEFYENDSRPVNKRNVEFGFKEFGMATIDWLILNVQHDPYQLPEVNITHFLGGFDEISIVKDADRVRFSVTNRTDRSSGTRIPGRNKPRYNQFLNDVIAGNPELMGMELSEILQNPNFQILSLLRAKDRIETSDWAFPLPEGGGNMWQTFSWTEAYIPCEISRYPYSSYLAFIDLGPDFKSILFP